MTLKVFLSFLLACGFVGAKEPANEPVQQETQPHEMTNDDLEAALASSKKRAPDVFDQAVRVWSNFKGKTKPSYVYYFWGRDLIDYLKVERNVAFPDGASVGIVFAKLFEKKLISEEAAKTLTMDSWNHLSHIHGALPWMKPSEPKSHIRPENIRPDYKGGEGQDA